MEYEDIELIYTGTTYDRNRCINIESRNVILEPVIIIKNKINNMINSLYYLFYN